MNPPPPKEEKEENQSQPERTVSKVGTNIGRVIYDQNTGIETMVRNQSSFSTNTLKPLISRAETIKRTTYLEQIETSKHRTLGFAVCFLRTIWASLNFLVMGVGICLIVAGTWALLRLRLDNIQNPLRVTSEPLFFVIILGCILILVSFDGALAFFRGNVLMITVHAWLLVFMFLIATFCSILLWSFSKMIKKIAIQGIFDLLYEYSPERKSVQFILDWFQQSQKCCGVLKTDDWQLNTYFCNFVDQAHGLCKPPNSCCKDFIPCTYEEAFKKGCLERTEEYSGKIIAILSIAWSSIWVIMILQIISSKFLKRRIQLHEKWKETYQDAKFAAVGEEIRIKMQSLN